MPNSKQKNLRRIPPVLLGSICLSFVIGILLLASASDQPIHHPSDLLLLAIGLRHDLGIALCVSSLIGLLFELYRGKWLEIENMKDVIDFVMGDKLTPEVWADVIDQLEDKRVIRQNVEFRLELQRAQFLPDHQAILQVEFKYDLLSLRNRRCNYDVRHELDYQFNLSAQKLPRWEQAEVDPMSALLEKEAIVLNGPDVAFKVSLPGRSHGEAVVIRTRRSEIVTLPGSYNFYVPEFMRGFHLQLIGCPPSFLAQAVIRPHGGAKPLQPSSDNSWTYDGLIFPGQGIEVKFLENTEEGLVEVDEVDCSAVLSSSGQPEANVQKC